MAILPPLKPIFEAQQKASPMPHDMPVAQMRDAMHAMTDERYFAFIAPRAPVAIERDFSIPVVGGEILLREYRPDAGRTALPCHLFYHGGGFFLGTLDQSDKNCRALAADLGCTVISVDYRLAPEHRFPTAVEDGYAALCWVAEHAAKLAIDSGRLSVGGASAGGNIAAVMCQMARDRNGPAIIAQILEIPVTDFTSTHILDFPAEQIHIDSAKPYAALYLRDESDARNPLASPLLAETLEDLPPALVMCAEYDQLQPEGEEYAERLVAAGVPTVYRSWEGQFHGSQNMDLLIPDQAAAYRSEIVTFLAEAYEGGSVRSKVNTP